MKKIIKSFQAWFFSRKDLATKFLCLVVLPFLFLLGTNSIKHYEAKKERDIAYLNLRKAIQNNEELTEMTYHIRQFFNHPPVYGKDRRLKNFLPVFEEKFTKWFLKTKNVNTEQLRIYKELYNQLRQ